jgi:hypothetical protein
MSWTFLAILAIITFFLVARCGMRLGIISRVPVTYSQRERAGWALAFALIASSQHILFGLALGAAIYFNGPQYYSYRINRSSLWFRS